MREIFWRRMDYIFGYMAVGLLFGLIVFAANIEIKDLDLWLHIATGRFIVANGYVPSVDVLYCSIAGQPWVNLEVLFQVLVYLFDSAFGSDGLITMQAVLVSITFLIMLFLAYHKDRQLGLVFMLLQVFLVYEFRFTIRPDIFSLFFFVLYIYILSLHIDRPSSVVSLFVVQVLWSNFHGFFFFGPLIVLIGIVSEYIKRHVKLPWEWNQVGRLNDAEYKRLKIILWATLLACLVNPMTFKGAWYPIHVLVQLSGESKIFFQYIQELQRPITWDNLFTPQYSYYKLLIILSFVSFLLNRRKIDISSFFFWIIFLVFSLVAARNIVFFAFVSYFICMSNLIGISLSDISPLRFTERKFAYLTSVIAKICLMIWMLDYGLALSEHGYYDFDKYERKSEFRGLSQRNYPNKAADFLVENNIKGNFFNDFNSGAYLLGRCHPQIKVFIDGRTEVYGAKFFNDIYQKAWKDGNKEILQDIIEKHGITGALLNTVYKPVPEETLKYFFNQKDWVLVYFDYDAVVFLKNVPQNKETIEKYKVDLSQWEAKRLDHLRLASTYVIPYRNINRAYTLETLGFDAQAIEEALEAIKIFPGYMEPYKVLGKIYGKKEDHRKAFENFRIATMISPEDPDVRYNLALAYEKLGELKYAIKQYEKIRKQAPEQPKASFMLSRALAKDKQFDLAKETLKRALKLDAQAVGDVLEIGDAVYDQKEFTVALDFYRLALKGKSKQAQVHYKLGQCHKALGDNSNAKKEFEEGLRNEPENQDIKKAIQEIGKGTTP